MIASSIAFMAASVTKVSAASVFVTPHDQYSSSIGVLGCKINTNRVAYWPSAVGCDDLCVKVSYCGRSTHLLKVDTSGGAHDVSYDAWNYLVFGKSAEDEPHMGGGVAMEYETVPMDRCIDLLDHGKLPLSAANSMNYVEACLGDDQSWAANNYVLYNIMDPVCKWGCDEKCDLDRDISNQPSCPSGLGNRCNLGDAKVVNIVYGTGSKAVA